MTALFLSLALIGLCSGGSCAAPSSAFSLPPSYSFPQFGEVLTIASEPTVYRMADAAGNVWRHQNKAYLEAWIAGRDAGIKAYRKAPGECSCDSCQCAEKAAENWKAKATPPAAPPAEKPPTARIDPAANNDDISPLVPKNRPKPATVRRYADAG